MADDPNETARRAFGEPSPSAPSQAPPPPPATAHAFAEPAATRPGPREVPLQQLSDWWTRAGAFVLDQLVVGGVALVVALIAAAIVNDPGSSVTEIVTYAVAIPIGLLYAPVLMARGGERNGQTLGKQVVGIRVVSIDGEQIGFWTGVMRTVVGQQLLIAITFYVYALVDYLWPLRDPQNQALHDKIAKTWVVRTGPSGAPPAAWDPPTPQQPQQQPGETPSPGWLPPQAPGA